MGRNDNRESIDPGMFLFIGIVGMIISIFLIPLASTENKFLTGILLVLPILFGIISMIGAIGTIFENRNAKKNIEKNMMEFQHEYDEYMSKLKIEKKDTQATLIEIGKYDLESYIPQYIWIDNEFLYMFPMSQYYKQHYISSISKPDISELKLKSVSVESILYFEEVGELRKYAMVSGGGSSLKGALVGYAIANDIGAMIGSREPIKTEVVSEDDRRIELLYYNQENEIENLEFAHDAYSILKKLIPSKELRRIKGLKDANNISNDIEITESNIIKEKLKQLNNLKAEELITDDEYLDKKKKILDLL